MFFETFTSWNIFIVSTISVKNFIGFTNQLVIIFRTDLYKIKTVKMFELSLKLSMI